jgi:hypothetical protein
MNEEFGMPRYIDSLDVGLSAPEAFDYLADVCSTAEWDPNVVAAYRLDGPESGIDSRFRVIVSALGIAKALEYRITRFDRPHRLELSGGDASIQSIHKVAFESRPGGTRITYSAQLELSGTCRLANPLRGLILENIGSLTTRGLRRRLDGEEPPLMKDNHNKPMKEFDR